jgi:hypothetical protein
MNDSPPTESGDLDELIDRLCDYLENHKVSFSSGQLSEAGEVFERYDYATAHMVVEGKEDPATEALVHVLAEVHRAKLSSDKSSYLIRHLNQIKKNRRKQK